MVDLRMLPCDEEAERAVLGACMQSGDAMLRIVPLLTVADFNCEPNAWTFGAISRLHDRGQRVDMLTVAHDLAQMEVLNEVGGREFLNRCVGSCPSPVGAEFYAEIVRRDSIYRQIISGVSNVMTAAYSAPPDPAIVLSQVDDMLAHIRGESGPKARTGADLVEELVQQVEAFAANPRALPGIPTPWNRLNHYLGGVRSKSLLTVGAATSVGKSLFLQNLAEWFGRKGKRFMVITTEMSASEWQLRMAYMAAGFDPEQAKRAGRVTPDQHDAIEAAIVEMAAWPVSYVEGSLNTRELVSEVRREKAQRQIEGVMVDHFGDIEGQGRAEHERMTTVAKALKLEVALGEKLWVVMSSHVNREATRFRVDKDGKESGEWVRLHHLYGSSAIEKYSDVVMLMTPIDADDLPMTDRQVSESQSGTVERVSVELGKNRKGRRGRVSMRVHWENAGGRIREG